MFWLGAAVSLCYVPGTTGAYIATQWPLLSVLMPPGLLRHGPFTVFHAVGLAFVVYAFALWFHSPVPYASVFGLWQITIMALCVWFGTTVTNMRGLYIGLAAGGAVSSMLAIFQFFGVETVVTAGMHGAAGLYVNPVQQGTVLALVAIALATERMWLWAAPLLPGIALTQSRGALIILAVGLAGCLVRRVWLLGSVAIVGVFYFLTPLSSSDAERMFIWRAAWDNLTWLGLGPGAFYAIVLPQNETYSLYPEYAHNDALQLAFEYGAGAVLPLVVFSYTLWRTDAKEWPIVLAFVAAGCFSMPLFMPVASFLALVAVGRILRDYGLAGRNCDRRGQHVVSREWSCARTGRQAVSLASHHTAEG